MARPPLSSWFCNTPRKRLYVIVGVILLSLLLIQLNHKWSQPVERMNVFNSIFTPPRITTTPSYSHHPALRDLQPGPGVQIQQYGVRSSWLHDLGNKVKHFFSDDNADGFHDVEDDVKDEVIVGCRSVLPGALHGRWVPKPNVSEARRREMDDFLRKTRGEFRIPTTLQRNDGKCGNDAYEGVPQYKHMWFRAVCNPEGPTPCCFTFQCTNRSIADCKCPLCIDSRLPVHAELSDWLPEESACGLRELNTSEACAALKGTTVILAGDSFVRHVFVALVMLLTGNFNNGALQKNTPPAMQAICQGMYQINGLRCRDFLDQNRTGLCDGSVNATYLQVMQSNQGGFLVPHVQELTSRGQRVLLVAGLGIHDDFRVMPVWTMFLQPLVDYFTDTTSNFTGNGTMDALARKLNITEFNYTSRQLLSEQPLSSSSSSSSSYSRSRSQRLWSKFIWANAHAPGLLKSNLLFPAQTFAGVKYYNQGIARLIESYGIPVLDSFNFTAPLHSVDGTHYGYGANMLKVTALLTWVRERQERGEWW